MSEREGRTGPAPATATDAHDGPPAAAATAVHLRDVLVAYGDHVALRVEDLRVPTGAVTAVIGPNGAGKSTLLGAIAGLVRPRRGTVEVFGSSRRSNRAAIAYVLQDSVPNEIVPITVREVVTMGRYATTGILRPLRRGDREAVRAAMERVDISDLGHRHLRELSAGQRQRVYVAQGLAQEGDLLLLDEPATGLDLPTHDRITTVMRVEADAGRTVVFTTHDVGEATEADVVVLVSGRVVASGPPDGVLTADHLATAYGGHVHVTADGAIVVDDPHHHRRPHAPAGWSDLPDD